MYPVIDIFGKQIGTYSLFALLGAFLCGTIFCIMINRKGLNDNQAIVFILTVVLGAVLGSHLLYAIVNYNYVFALFSSSSFGEVAKNLFLLFGGSVFYGGLLGGIIAASVSIKVMNVNFRIYSDCLTPLIPLFHAIARVGCFFAGCCFGKESSFGFVVNGNKFIPEINGVCRFPVQLLETACNLLLSLFLFLLLRRSEKVKTLQGVLIWIYLLMYSVVRFFDEFLRGDVSRGFVGILSTSQFISVLLFAISIIYLIIRHKKMSQGTAP